MNNENVCSIPMNRLKHCYMVGKVMEYVAREIFQMPERECQEMFFLGNIHDSMYDFENDEQKHNEILSQIVSERYARSVLEHSRLPKDGFQSVALDLLYFADQIVDGYGNVCSFKDRIADIYERHGLEDGVYQDTINIVSYLRENGYENIEQKVLNHFCTDKQKETTITFCSYENLLLDYLTEQMTEQEAAKEVLSIRNLLYNDMNEQLRPIPVLLQEGSFCIYPDARELTEAIIYGNAKEFLASKGFSQEFETEWIDAALDDSDVLDITE